MELCIYDTLFKIERHIRSNSTQYRASWLNAYYRKILWYNTHLVSRANEAKQKWYDKIAWTPDACEAYWQVMGYLQSQRGYLVDVRQVELEKFREQGRLYKRMYGKRGC